MIEEITPDAGSTKEEQDRTMDAMRKEKLRKKRDIIRFNGEKPMAINLDHVTSMYLEGKRITFEFYTKSQFIDLVDENSAASIFEIILSTWSSDIEVGES